MPLTVEEVSVFAFPTLTQTHPSHFYQTMDEREI